MGNPEQDDRWLSGLADDLGILVVSVDYRLAPEHPYPAGLDDCMTALRWLHDSAEELGVDPDRVAVGGASAGGGLAAAVALSRRTDGPRALAGLLDELARAAVAWPPGHAHGSDTSSHATLVARWMATRTVATASQASAGTR